ncbi:helix-turn-helix transcriptional regulator [Andreprevotia chitinilytica]|uniref:helix-turn-helix transcriptional regulator n=1 Tax=Andreprevotia chitinilytica TaxID=396808 RepID=UPI001B805E47|nr:AlpA family transcriptional regulator [Andreprevotia chitinilytica]
MMPAAQQSPIAVSPSAPTVDYLLRLPYVCKRVALSRSSIYAAVAAGTFPKPVRLGGNSVAWLESEVAAWIAARIAERDGVQ